MKAIVKNLNSTPPRRDIVHEIVASFRWMDDARINRKGPQTWDIDFMLALAEQRERDTANGVPTDAEMVRERHYKKRRR